MSVPQGEDTHHALKHDLDWREMRSSFLVPACIDLHTGHPPQLFYIVWIDVTIAGLAGKDPVTCARDCIIVPDVAFADVKSENYDVIVLPGGMGGSQALAASADVGQLLKKQEERGAFIAAVCAAPIALDSHGIAQGKRVTSHPAVKDTMVKGGYTYVEERVVIDGKFITSRGPGTCFEFALAIVTELQSKEKSDALIGPMLVKM